MLNISLIVMFKFLFGVVIGMFICETYDYTFTDLISTIEDIFNTTK